jgi:hypothetical protein
MPIILRNRLYYARWCLLEGRGRGKRDGKKDKEPGPNLFLLLSEPQIPGNPSKLLASCIM